MRFSLLICSVLLVIMIGCQALRPYPAILDDPSAKEAMINAFADGYKHVSSQGDITNPEVEFYYKVAVGARVIGISSSAQLNMSAGDQESPTTQPTTQPTE